jgi:hypothetical protein
MNTPIQIVPNAALSPLFTPRTTVSPQFSAVRLILGTSQNRALGRSPLVELALVVGARCWQ